MSDSVVSYNYAHWSVDASNTRLTSRRMSRTPSFGLELRVSCTCNSRLFTVGFQAVECILSYVLRGIRRRQYRYLLSPEKEKKHRQTWCSIRCTRSISPGVGRGPDLADIRHGVRLVMDFSEKGNERGSSLSSGITTRSALMSIPIIS